ncbi:MAG: RNA methyltransferase [Pyrinomonadaceae bacterium]
MNEITKISSRNNAKLVRARQVRDGKIDDLIFIEGLRLSVETLRSGLTINDCFVTRTFAESERGGAMIDDANARNIAVFEVAESSFPSVADTKNSQGVILIAGRPVAGREEVEKNIQSAKSALVVFLSEINDPSNLGAVFRTAEAAGVAGVVVSKGSADVFAPKALRAAMGASLRLPVWENADVADLIQWSKANRLRTTAADISAETFYTDIDWKQRRLIIFGSEAHGLKREVLEIVDDLVLIPMQNDVESLNVAVSAGIILFETVRQRSLRKSLS